MWEHFSHQADIGIKASAGTLPEVFEQAAVALTAIVTEPGNVEQTESVQIECSAENNELLLVDWLNSIIYEMAVRKMLFSKFEVSIENLKLSAKIWGEKINQEKHLPAVEPKAVTYNQLSVKNENGKWTVQCVIDV
ncbi:MAG: archease [Planctomycetes bacterium]|nr:archease [Planctomycetota bacterium]MBU1517691.1 archease [Planctomycetota bacterium]MBU2458482.1 archease [Planctomycetota bacterium]MBU2597028.1 archease [Planctomycetota bacterium]